jgi:hypothetical protein
MSESEPALYDWTSEGFTAALPEHDNRERFRRPQPPDLV